MMKKKRAVPDDPEQSQCFLEAAKGGVADETEKDANGTFKKVVRPKKP
jgi:hypothetical protein